MICSHHQEMMKQRIDAVKPRINSVLKSGDTVNSSRLRGVEVLYSGNLLINKPEQEEQDITLDRIFARW